jgi:hypothetical protein
MLVRALADGVFGSQVLDPFGSDLVPPPSPASGCALGVLTGLLHSSSGRGRSLGCGLPSADSVWAGSGAIPSSQTPSGSATPGVWLSSDRRSMLAGLMSVRSVVALLDRGAFGQRWLWCGDGCLVSVKTVLSVVDGVVLCAAAKVLCG